MSSTSTSATGLPDSEIQAAVPIGTHIDYPDLPAISSACNTLINALCTGLSKIPIPGLSLIGFGIHKLVDSGVLHLKEHILNALSTSHKDFSEIVKEFCEAKGIKESFKAVGNMFQWAIGKGLYSFALKCMNVLGLLIALNDATIEIESVKEWLTSLKQDFETAVTFQISPRGITLSAERQTDEHQVAVKANPAPVSQPAASLAEKSDATHDVKTRDQRTLARIQKLLDDDQEVRDTLQQMQPLETEGEMIRFLLALVNANNPLERLLAVVLNLRAQQSA
ncbi:MAG: hypothetical protein LBJ78_02570 [Puniceicoccales bacterium]|jgi:hypothetical protein|nr:hypothetical protein [Puniceicoccales bacterium]